MTAQTAIRVLLVNSERLMFEGLVSVLADYEDLEVVGVAISAVDAVEKAKLLKPDLLVIDMHLGDSNGAQACEQVRAAVPGTAVLFLSPEVGNVSMERAVQAGAAGYLSTGVSTDELVAAIRKLADGEMLVTTSVLTRLMREGPTFEESEAPAPSSQLTARERDLLARIARGEQNADIARELGLERAAVRSDVRAVLEKLGVHSKVQAVDAARRAGLLTATEVRAAS